MVNCCVENQLITTRPGMRVLPLGEDGNELRKSNVQGAVFYAPARGQSQQRFGPSEESVIISAGGKKFQLKLRSGVVSISNETASFPGAPDAHIVWMWQAENYILCQDGVSKIWIWDGVSEAFTSSGYDVDFPEQSRLAQGASAGAYAHGRILQVVDGNRVLIGDIIHKTRFFDPVNILGMTEQIYYATGAYSSPPSSMGKVTAIGLLPLSNTLHGHDDVIIHMERGCYSLKIDHFPRTEWPAKAVSKHLLVDTAATGPFALLTYDGDQMFRSKFGIQTIRSAAQSSQVVGNPALPISDPIHVFLRDHPDYLRFASMAKWQTNHRILCTVGLWADGWYRGGRGMVSFNLNADGSASSDAVAWEGLWTLPYGMGLPTQIIDAKFGSDERLLVLTHDKSCDGFETRVVEMSAGLKHDVLEDGERRRISCAVVTAMHPTENTYNEKTFRDGTVCFVNVQGVLDWGVWARNNDLDAWTEWKRGKFESADECDMAAKLATPKSYRLNRHLGDPPDSVKKGQFIQLMVRWRGYCQIESISVGYEEDTGSNAPEPDGDREEEMAACDPHDDFEYTRECGIWEDQL
jgi:hypothetical protein